MGYQPIFSLMPFGVFLLVYLGIVLSIFVHWLRPSPKKSGLPPTRFTLSGGSPNCWTCRSKFAFQIKED